MLSLALVLLLAGGSARAQVPPSPDEWIPFEANWSASGSQHTLSMGDREASTIELSGPFLVTSGESLSRGFRADVIGFVDRGAIGIGRLVLTDERGDQIFNDLRGEEPGTGKRIVATMTGGTGRYAALEGDFAFSWQYLIRTADGGISGRAVGLKGRFRRPPGSSAGGGRAANE